MALLHLEPRPIETVGVQETRAFTMKANGKAFKVLIDGLYSDKVRAVIRELWSNAYDSHIAADVADVPFQTHLPTSYEPWFAVRDFGTSLSHDDVMGLYTTVFASSKEDNNTQVGKLGLGSKSPFAYTDTFTVTAWLDGEKRTYSAFIGADYIPQIALMNREPSDEPRGLEVSFPVNDGNASAFIHAATNTAIGFDTLPEMTGARLTADPRGARLSGGDGWALYEKLGRAFARQGCVVYPIDRDSIPYDAEVMAILGSGILIDFPIGALEISASREGLGYDKATVAQIVAHTKKIYGEMEDALRAEISNHTTLWDKMIFLGSLDKSVPTTLIHALRREIFGSDAGILSYDPPTGIELQFFDGTQIKRAKQPKRISRPSEVMFNNMRKAGVCFINTAQPPVKNHWARLTRWAQAGDFDGVYTVRYHSGADGSIAAELMAAFEGAPEELFCHMHELPDPPKAARGARTSVKIKARRLQDAVRLHRMNHVDIDTKAGGYFVPAEHGKFAYGVRLNGDDVYAIFRRLKRLGIVPMDAVAYVVPSSIKSVKDGKNGWVDVFKLARETLNGVAAEIAAERHRSNYASGRVDLPADLLRALPKGHILARYAAETKTLQTESGQNWTDAVLLGSALRYEPWNFQDNALPAPTGWETVTAAYPLIRDLSRINDENKLHVLEYVTLIDNRQTQDQAAA